MGELPSACKKESYLQEIEGKESTKPTVTTVELQNFLYAKKNLTEDRTSGTLERISCFLAGELEVPEHIAGWKVLCPASSLSEKIPSTSTRSVITTAGQKRKFTTESFKGDEIKAEGDLRQQKIARHRYIRIPLIWEACLLVLWEHAIKYSFVNQAVSHEAFIERIRRIGVLATRSLNQRGFFTIKHLLGNSRALKIYQWATDTWKCCTTCFHPGSTSLATTLHCHRQSREWVAWFSPEEPSTSNSISVSLPEVRLLFLYLDAIIRIIGSGLQNRTGTGVEIDSRSWTALSVFTKPQNCTRSRPEATQQDCPTLFPGGCQLAVMYFLNPEWNRNNGGELVLLPAESGTIDNTSIVLSAFVNKKRPTLAISPVIDRAVMFYADGRTPYVIRKIRPNARPAEQLALTTWYFEKNNTSGDKQQGHFPV